MTADRSTRVDLLLAGAMGANPYVADEERRRAAHKPPVWHDLCQLWRLFEPGSLFEDIFIACPAVGYDETVSYRCLDTQNLRGRQFCAAELLNFQEEGDLCR